MQLLVINNYKRHTLAPLLAFFLFFRQGRSWRQRGYIAAFVEHIRSNQWRRRRFDPLYSIHPI